MQAGQLRLDSPNEAGIDHPAVHHHGAGSAITVVAPLFRPCQVQDVSQTLQEALAGFAKKVDILAVDRRPHMRLGVHTWQLQSPLMGGLA